MSQRLKPAYVQLFILAASLFFLTINFYSNPLHLSPPSFFDTYQQDSESLVLGRILHQKSHPDRKEKFNLGHASASGKPLEVYELLEKNKKNNYYTPYTRQYGLQGDIFAIAYQYFATDQINKLKLLCSVLTALMLMFFCALIRQTYGHAPAIVVFVVFAFSPWFIAISNNLYWAPFNWFIPIIFGLVAYSKLNTPYYKYYVLTFGLAVFTKMQFGSEFISSILIAATFAFAIDPFRSKPKLSLIQAIKQLSLLILVSLVAFLLALSVLADLRGDTILEGFSAIWTEDVLRRTYGDPSDFHPIFAESLSVSPVAVVQSYFNDWSTDLFIGVSNAWFKPLIFCTALSLTFLFFTKDVNRKLYSILLLTLFMIPLSWFILAKGHSHIHKHINFVLWYMGPIQAMSLVIGDATIKFVKFFIARCQRDIRFIAFIPLLIFGGLAANSVYDNHIFGQAHQVIKKRGQSLFHDGGSFEIYATNNNQLSIVNRKCEGPDGAFSIEYIATHTTLGTQNNEIIKFKWKEKQVAASNWLSDISDVCIAEIDAPHYNIKKLFLMSVNKNKSINWRQEANLDELEKSSILDIEPFPDAEFKNGISLSAPAFVLMNNFKSRQAIREGSLVALTKSGKRRIVKILATPEIIFVITDGGLLDAELDGSPNRVKISSY